MSLLMDALRKAEEAKRQNAESSDAAPSSGGLSELSLEPLPAAAKAPPAAVQPTSPLPILSQHLDSLNADLAATSAATPTTSRRPPATPAQTTASSDEEKERNAARNVFAAKQSRQTRSRRWLIVGLIALAVVGIGAYFWWQMQSVSSGAIVRSAHSVAPAPVEPISLPPAPEQPPIPAPTPPAEAAQVPTPLAEPIRPPARPEPSARPAPPAATPEGPVRRSTRQPVQDPMLDGAYEALLADRLNDARRDYEQVLRKDPRNIDALLGLATIASRQGQSPTAAEYYRRALEADPKDLNALAGLINLKGQTDPALSESRLKAQLAAQPDSAALNFALGNLHANQNRWGDAQQAYFRAYTAEPGNADYLYNLAVSLDHLRQNRLAAQYYQSALNAAGTRSTVFDKEQVKSRLLDLQP